MLLRCFEAVLVWMDPWYSSWGSLPILCNAGNRFLLVDGELRDAARPGVRNSRWAGWYCLIGAVTFFCYCHWLITHAEWNLFAWFGIPRRTHEISASGNCRGTSPSLGHSRLDENPNFGDLLTQVSLSTRASHHVQKYRPGTSNDIVLSAF